MFLIEILGEGCVALGHSLPSATAAGDFRQSPLLGFKKQRKSTTDDTSTGRVRAGARNGAREGEGRVDLPEARRGDLSAALGEAGVRLGAAHSTNVRSGQVLNTESEEAAPSLASAHDCGASTCH